MKNQILFYSIFYIVTVIVTAIIGFFVLPVFAMCDCLYDTIKSLLIFPGSLIAAAITLYFLRNRIERGESRKRASLKSLFFVSLVYIILSLANVFINM